MVAVFAVASLGVFGAPAGEMAAPDAAKSKDDSRPPPKTIVQKTPMQAPVRRRPTPPLVTAAPPPDFRGPDVTLIADEERTVYEYRQNGQLRMIKVVPKFGKPYYLAPFDRTRGFGDLEQAKTLVAEWVLWEF